MRMTAARRACALLLALAPPLVAQEANAPPPITATAAFATDAFIGADEPIEIVLSRSPSVADGRWAVVVGTQDMTALFEEKAGTLVFRSSGFRLPAGSHDVKVFMVSGGAWTELGRFPLKVRTRRGFETASIDPGLTINNTGQVAERHTGAAPAPERPTYQDGNAAAGLQTTHARGGWTVRTQINAVGVTNEREALRFGTQGPDAARFDLADYVVSIARPGAQLSAGHVSLGSNPHLINAYGSRGITASIGRGVATLTAGALNGTSIVGWDNIAGLNNPDHRMAAATLALELKPSRPGGLHIDVSALDGSLMPNTSYNEGGIVDAETSRGLGVQFAASTPGQRLRASGGMTRSRFADAVDDQLFGDTTIVRAQPRRKAARYAEAAAGLLQDYRLFSAISTTLNASYRHERVEPQYRSVAAYTQSDVERNAFELGGSIDAFTFQFGRNHLHDNLDDVPSILTTLTDVSGGTLSVPLAALFRVTKGAALLPMLSLGRQQTHQRGKAVPTNADFSAGHVPDQLSVMDNASAQWQGSRLRFGYGFNRSKQDNRQTGRENSDLVARSHSFMLGVIAHAKLDIQIETNLEEQENLELAQTSRLRRVGISGNWRADALTTIDAFISTSKGEDPASSSDSRTTDARLGIARGIRFWRTAEGGAPGQIFVRVARQDSRFSQFGDPLLAPPAQKSGLLNVATGFTLRLF